MQMRAGGAARGADAADDLANANGLPDFDIDGREVRVARRKTVAVIDLDHLAVTAVPARHRDGASRCSAGGLACVGTDVEARVHRGRAEERVRAHSEARGPFQFTG